MNKLPIDHAVREEVIDPRRSFVVSAPAGSGKTGLLTHRVLKLLCVVQKPEEILAITFTRKAAAEMHERIFQCLHKANSTTEEEAAAMSAYDRELLNTARQALQRNTELDWNLLSSPRRLNILTIDGFCKSICNQLPFFSGLGSSTAIISSTEIEYDNVVKRWLLDTLKQKNDDHISLLLEHFSGDINRLVKLLSQLLQVRDQWLPLIGLSTNSNELKEYFENTLREWIYQSIDSVLGYWAIYEGELFDHLAFAYKNKDEAKDPSLLERLSKYSELPNWKDGAEHFWRDLAKFCLTGSKFRKRLDKNLGFPSSKNKAENEVVKERKAAVLRMFSELEDSGLRPEQFAEMSLLPEAGYSQDQWQILDALVSVLPKITAYLKLRFCELGQADFTEFSLGAVRALDSDLGDIDLQQRLDYQIHHILIDEFQDTSQTQLDLLKALTKEWMPDEGKTLFLVGDGMQSCYGFRNANVGIFLRMRQQGLPNLDLHSRDLSVNFRSSSSIVDWVNSAFTPAFPNKDDINSGAVKYIPSSAFNAAHKTSYIRFNAHPKATSDEADFIAEEITSLLKDYPEESIAVIARSRSHLSQVIQAFEKNDIDFSALDFDLLKSKQHIIDAHSIAQFLFDSGNKLAYLALLRSPFCGLNHADLYAVFHAEDKHETVSGSMLSLTKIAIDNNALSADGLSRLRRFFNTATSVFESLYRRSFSECVELLWLKLGGAECLNNSAELHDIQKYFSLLGSYEEANTIKNWQEVESTLKKEFANPVTRTSNPVQIMTMHKSKGLEFDTVFLPSLNKRKKNDDPEALYWLEKLDESFDSHFILSPISAKQSGIENAITKYIKSKKSEKSAYEDTRIFYVACTRARQRLYLSASFDTTDDGELKPPEKNSLIAQVWPNIEDQVELNKVQLNKAQLNTVQQNTQGNTVIRALPEDWAFSLSSNAKQVLPPAQNSVVFDNTDFNFFQNWQDQHLVSRLKGIVIHSLLQSAGELGIRKILSMAPERIQNFINVQLSKEGVSPSELSHYSDELMELCSTLFLDKKLQWILSEQHVQAKCEWSLWSNHSGETQEHIIDRSFIDGSTRWIIDYKSAQPTIDQSLESFVEEQFEAYAPQLLRYRELVARYDQSSQQSHEVEDIQLGLYFPLIQYFAHYTKGSMVIKTKTLT